MVVRCAGRGLRLVGAVVILCLGWGCGSSHSNSGGDTSGNTTGNTSGNPVSARTVTGYISDITTGQGVPGATVNIGGLVSQTGPTGLYTVRAVPRTAQTVQITATNYKDKSTTLSSSTDQLSVRLVPVGVPDDYEPPPDEPGL